MMASELRLARDNKTTSSTTANTPVPLTPLQQAAKDNDVEKIKQLLAAGIAQLEAQTNTGATALHIAAEAGYAEIASLLINHGAKIDARTDRGSMPLHMAVSKGHVGVLEVLIKNGARVDATLPNGFTALHIAAEFGQLQAVNKLMDEGADVKAETDGFTPLHIAAKNGHKQIAIELVDRGGAEVDKKGSCDMTPLYLAAQKGHAEVAGYLIRHGANINAETTKFTTPASLVQQKQAELAKRTNLSPEDQSAKNKFAELKKVFATEHTDINFIPTKPKLKQTKNTGIGGAVSALIHFFQNKIINNPQKPTEVIASNPKKQLANEPKSILVSDNVSNAGNTVNNQELFNNTSVITNNNQQNSDSPTKLNEKNSSQITSPTKNTNNINSENGTIAKPGTKQPQLKSKVLTSSMPATDNNTNPNKKLSSPTTPVPDTDSEKNTAQEAVQSPQKENNSTLFAIFQNLWKNKQLEPSTNITTNNKTPENIDNKASTTPVVTKKKGFVFQPEDSTVNSPENPKKTTFFSIIKKLTGSSVPKITTYTPEPKNSNVTSIQATTSKTNPESTSNNLSKGASAVWTRISQLEYHYSFIKTSITKNYELETLKALEKNNSDFQQLNNNLQKLQKFQHHLQNIIDNNPRIKPFNENTLLNYCYFRFPDQNDRDQRTYVVIDPNKTSKPNVRRQLKKTEEFLGEVISKTASDLQKIWDNGLKHYCNYGEQVETDRYLQTLKKEGYYTQNNDPAPQAIFRY